MNSFSPLASKAQRAVVCSEDRLLVQELQEQISRLRNATIFALNEMLDLKDIDTGLHSTRLAEWAVRVGGLLDVGTRVRIDHGVARGARGHVDARQALRPGAGQAEWIGLA